MKGRIGAVLLSLLMTMLIMVGCGSSNQTDKTTATDNTEAATQPVTEATKEYYGVDLVNKPLSEIIEIMGGDFQTEYEGKHLINYTSGGFCIFNNDTLPGFAFFVKPAEGYSYDDLADPMTDLSGAKQDVLEGKYDSIDFLGVYDSGKYNETISADMTYLEVSEAIGSYELAPVVGSAMPRQSIDSNATVWYDAGEMNEETAKTENPKIKGISVRPSENASAEAPTEAEEKPTEAQKKPSQSDYSSYLGSWNYVFDNDGQLDENYAVVTSVTFNEINGTTADITIFKGNISKVCQIDVTGEIVDGKIDFSYNKDGWLNSGHGTITLNGDSIHLYAEVDSYGENARMGLVCDDDLTR